MQSKKIQEIIDNIKDFSIKVKYFIPDTYSLLKERIGRILSYAKFSYRNYDFDSAFLYSLMSFKLKRLRNCLINGIAVQQENDMKALDEAISICDRLHADSHDLKYYDNHDEKWGELECDFSSGCFKSSRKNVKTKEDKAKELKETLEIYNKAEQDRKNDIDRLSEILKTNAPAWWE